MIVPNKEIKVFNAADKERWTIRPVSSPYEFFQYYKEDICFEPPEVEYQHKYGDINFSIMSKYYYKKNLDSTDYNSSSKKMAAFVVDFTEWGQKEFELFLFPMNLYLQIKNAPGSVGHFDWKITKTGEGLETRYYSEQLSRTKRTNLTKAEKKVIKGTIEGVSMDDILIKKLKITTQISYTPFNRFDILDFD